MAKDVISIDTSELFGGKPVKEYKRKTIRKSKVGRKPWTPTKKRLDRLYVMLMKGIHEHQLLWPNLGLEKTTWYEALTKFPELTNVLEQGISDYYDKVIEKYDDILEQPQLKGYAQHVRHSVDRIDKKFARLQVDATVTVRPYEGKSEAELLKLAEADDE